MYTKRTKRFFTAKGIINNAKKVAVLLTVIGGKAYVLLRNLLAPAKPAEKSFNVLVKIMKDHLKPKSLMIAKRFKFHWHNQHERETVTQYLTELRKFSEQCDFKEYLKEALHDRLVCGLWSEVIQRRLLAEENLTFKKGQELALGMKTTAKNVCELQGTRCAAEPRLQRNVCRVQREVTNDCYRCGNQNHKSAQCPFRTTRCDNCGKVGHIRKVCRQPKRPSTSQGRQTTQASGRIQRYWHHTNTQLCAKQQHNIQMQMLWAGCYSQTLQSKHLLQES